MTARPPEVSIPRRDFIVLPLISLLTVLMMTGVAESVSRQIWVEKSSDDCVYKNPVLGERHRASCVMMMKNIEGPWVRYEMNDCGYRSAASCGPKPPGTLRVVIMGTSAAFGLDVPYDEYFANRAAPELTRIWAHPVEFQNLGGIGPDYWPKSDIVLNEVLSLKPDAVFYVVLPFDLTHMDYLQSARPENFVASPPAKKNSWNWTDVRLATRESRFLFMVQHFMLRDENFFLRAFESYADPFDVSRKPTPPLVERRFTSMDMLVGRLADRVHAAGTPSFILAVPNRAESALISKNIEVPQMDAYVFPRRMEEIAQKHGVGYIDVVPDLQKTPNAEQLFYAVDGHPTGGAHALLASAVIDYFRHRGSLAESIQAAVKK